MNKPIEGFIIQVNTSFKLCFQNSRHICAIAVTSIKNEVKSDISLALCLFVTECMSVKVVKLLQ